MVVRDDGCLIWKHLQPFEHLFVIVRTVVRYRGVLQPLVVFAPVDVGC